MKQFLAVLLVMMAMFSFGCILGDDGGDDGDGGGTASGNATEYLPFQTGASWTFDCTETWSGETDTYTYTTTVTGQETLNGKTYWKMEDTDDPGYPMYLRIAGNAVYEYMNEEQFYLKPAAAKIAEAMRAAAADLPDEYVIFDFDKKAGQTWEMYSYADSDEGYSASMSMTGKRLSNRTVEVPAGTFTDCAAFEITMTSTYSYSMEGHTYNENWQDTTVMMFAKDVGPVKITGTSAVDGEQQETYSEVLASYSTGQSAE